MSTEKYLTGKTAVAGVMGWPISHSKSPRLHGYWLNKHGIDGAYIPMAVRPEETEAALRALPVLGFRGTNLTIPHKEIAMKIVDHIDPLAQRAGAVNTIIVRKDCSLEGRNTDVYGFSENLKSFGYKCNPENPVATVLGAGGAARAIVVALQDMGFQEIRIVNRNVERAECMTASLARDTHFKVMSWEDTVRALSDTHLLVNATSLGMVGQPALDVDLSPMRAGSWVTDAVYAPLETDLLKQAKSCGLMAVDGIGMLLHQAKPGFAAWFDCEPEVTQELRDLVLDGA